jgi:hypothetical protein
MGNTNEPISTNDFVAAQHLANRFTAMIGRVSFGLDPP